MRRREFGRFAILHFVTFRFRGGLAGDTGCVMGLARAFQRRLRVVPIGRIRLLVERRDFRKRLAQEFDPRTVSISRLIAVD